MVAAYTASLGASLCQATIILVVLQILRHSLKKLYFEGRRSLMQASHICNRPDFQQAGKDLFDQSLQVIRY